MVRTSENKTHHTKKVPRMPVHWLYNDVLMFVIWNKLSVYISLFMYFLLVPRGSSLV